MPCAMTQKLYKPKEKTKLHSKSLKYGHHAESSPSSRSTAIASANSKSCWGIGQIGSNPVTHHRLHLQQAGPFYSILAHGTWCDIFLYTCNKKLSKSNIDKTMWGFKRNLLSKVEWAIRHLTLEEVIVWVLGCCCWGTTHHVCHSLERNKQHMNRHEEKSWAHPMCNIILAPEWEFLGIPYQV